MTDQIQKNLDKLSEKERQKINKILISIKNNQWTDLDLKKLKNHEKIFRVRKGDVRIIFKKSEEKIFILAIERRSDNTYENL
ncbi:MAG: hypothetical protein UX09_C0032G0006 [Candidatus Uhrbacteria bacterium GW2011_GWE2_45_35]|uniref:Type II toxin-antitoxin system RelE/ParE family toxin n=2 Tax=Candidatus Uhriibacteriota TaxID=1752732 RepID=A0A0G1JFH4_9BACT|nr:MAG: hypothetical protein UW63_C0026G0006 [Candidatus Uhrbacteria bacterium GW2011_GWF2_44_350]KKU07273.1 MAG: hypothetical protein UX09_C0032G0006 [Candidatus Uhrbacteria bacterium GW2011_GWE2_45_35]HBR80419.1 hypothetical protein [Candidatus Uhrbacteria bacterium]HCU31182.1 hypothetical protein [Candidatus Uhrbacteria bacterium]